jgi:hypothetical protein
MHLVYLDGCRSQVKELTEDILAIYGGNDENGPEGALTTAGAWTRPTEAEQAAKLIMASGRASHKEPVHAMPRLPHYVQEVRQAQGLPALPLPELPQELV